MRHPSTPARPSRRRFLAGGAGLVFAPALIGCQTDGSAHAASTTRDQGPQFRLQPAGVWRLELAGGWPPGIYPQKIMFSPAGDRVAVQINQAIRIHEFPSGKEVTRLSYAGTITRDAFGFGHDGRTIIALHERAIPGNPMAQVFDAESGSHLRAIASPLDDGQTRHLASGLTTSANGEFCVVRLGFARAETKLVALDLKNGVTRSIIGQSEPRRRVLASQSISADGMIAVSERNPDALWSRDPGSLSRFVSIYDSASGRRIVDFLEAITGEGVLIWSPDGTLLAIGAPTTLLPRPDPTQPPGWPQFEAIHHAAWVWDTRARRTTISFPRIHAPMRNIAFSPDNRWLATTRVKYSRQLGSGLSVWRLSDGAEMFAYETPDLRLIHDVAFSPSGAHFIFAEDRELKIFRVIA